MTRTYSAVINVVTISNLRFFVMVNIARFLVYWGVFGFSNELSCKIIMTAFFSVNWFSNSEIRFFRRSTHKPFSNVAGFTTFALGNLCKPTKKINLKNPRWSSMQWPEIKGDFYTYLFPILLQNKQKPIRNSCRNNLWSKLILILLKYWI